MKLRIYKALIIVILLVASPVSAEKYDAYTIFTQIVTAIKNGSFERLTEIVISEITTVRLLTE